jgi:hypothetical protein
MKNAPDNLIRRLLRFVIVVLASSASTLSAGVNVWTTHGPSVKVDSLGIERLTPATLYARAGDGSSNSGGGEWGMSTHLRSPPRVARPEGRPHLS